MTQRTSRGFPDKASILSELEHGRRGAIKLCTQAKIKSPEYTKASELVQQIDEVAELLTDDPTYFHIKMAPSTPH